ncbi:DUF881 domain-containing protein [Kitasatospora sp. DSM 101779]|uniref:DUF881 domain-containing protein n=1 Tax=Kitasatospora sp. DSM 101779 TaxID=2853165 RepID=UPI0021D9E3FE|nr:DUF881 domain-containing protein [Kitasatospora sp. DSM 101779]
MEQDDKPNGAQVPPSEEGAASEPRKAPGKPAEAVAGERAEGVTGEPDPAAEVAGPGPDRAEPAAAQTAARQPEPEPMSRPEPEPRLEPVAEPVSEQVEPDGRSEPGETVETAEPADSRRRMRAALWPPRLSRGQLVVAVLLFALGLGLAIQVRSTNDHNQLRGARQEDLVRILDELDSRQQRLQQEKTQLEQSLTQLENSSNQAKEAQEQTRKKATELGVLAGTEQATGPGIVLTINDPQGQVKADMLLDTLQELRAAGAEAIQINDVRVVAGTYFTDGADGGVQIDGKKVSQPFRFTVVGNPQDLTPALNIPGGVVRTLEKEQATAVITQQQKVVVDALAESKPLRYGKPAAK